MNRSCSNKALRKKKSDSAKIFDALKKLERIFIDDSHLMLQFSELLIKESTLTKSPNPSGIRDWISRRTTIHLTMNDARSLLLYVALQLAKDPNLKHCALLPPHKSEYFRWCEDLKNASKKTKGGNVYEVDEPDEVKIFSVDDHKLKRRPSQKDINITKKLQESEDPTRLMFPSVSVAQPKSILKDGGSKDKDSSIQSNDIVPIKFKKTSNSMSYKRFGSFADSNTPMSVADMVALARKKQHYERLQRQYEEELNSGKKSVDYSLVDKKRCQIPRVLPQLKEISFNEMVDKKLFGEKRGLCSINEFGVYCDSNTLLKKAKPRFDQESSMVKNEVYSILGVRADRTLHHRKY